MLWASCSSTCRGSASEAITPLARYRGRSPSSSVGEPVNRRFQAATTAALVASSHVREVQARVPLDHALKPLLLPQRDRLPPPSRTAGVDGRVLVLGHRVDHTGEVGVRAEPPVLLGRGRGVGGHGGSRERLVANLRRVLPHLVDQAGSHAHPLRQNPVGPPSRGCRPRGSPSRWGRPRPCPSPGKSSRGMLRQGASWSSTLLWASRASTQVKPVASGRLHVVLLFVGRNPEGVGFLELVASQGGRRHATLALPEGQGPDAGRRGSPCR